MQFEVGQSVQVYSGEYMGYYGTVLQMGDGVALVSHKQGFAGFWIDLADLVEPEPLPPETEPEAGAENV